MENNSNQKLRLPEMDVMKGMLSIMVIIGHIIYTEEKVSGVQVVGHIVDTQNILCGVWMAPYLMAGFFFVTGFCSSFEKDIRMQVLFDAKHLLLPSITIMFIMTAIVVLLGKGFDWSYAAPWFLWSLFWAKLFFRFIKHFVKSRYVALFLLAIMSFIGSTMMYYMPEKNFLGYQQALVFPLFLAMGIYVKEKNLKTWVFYLASGIYATYAILTFYYLKWGAISISAVTSVSPEKWPSYILLATSGTLGILQFSRLLSRNKILQYIGRNSLIMYLMHIAFLLIVTSHLKLLIAEYNGNSIFQWCFFILMALGALLWSCLWAWVLNLPYLRWLQGKW